MKIFDIVKLINAQNYADKGLDNDYLGIVVKCEADFLYVLFFNKKNIGDAIIVKTSKHDVVNQNLELPDVYKKELINKLEFNKYLNKSKLQTVNVKEYDIVILVVERDKYANYGIHKGMTGTVMSDYAVGGECLVDFSGINQNGEYYGDCISVKIQDILVIE